MFFFVNPIISDVIEINVNIFKILNWFIRESQLRICPKRYTFLIHLVDDICYYFPDLI